MRTKAMSDALLWLAALACVFVMIAAGYAVTSDNWLPQHITAIN